MFQRIMSVFCLLTFLISLAPLNVLASTGRSYGNAKADVLTDDEMKGISGGTGGKGGGGQSAPTGSLGGSCYTTDSANINAPGVKSIHAVSKAVSAGGVTWSGLGYSGAQVPIVRPGAVWGADVTLSGPTSKPSQASGKFGEYGFSGLQIGDYSVSASWTEIVEDYSYGKTYTYNLSGSNSGTVVANQNIQIGINMKLTTTVN